ncbi:MAG: tRNA (N6-isopentenyl adenosine(37)-C2)-methylthiotransferase MiaB [Bacillota bacterium]|nr:tRNA (N6-isopentenyl adenosine(37)-C2)-methylthiotransferase MiaB [Bacillota bacterium]
MTEKVSILLYDDEKAKAVRRFNDGRSPKYLIRTYGCQMNEHDSEGLAGMLEEMGYSPAENVQGTSLVLFNTCCVREHAELKAYSNVGALKKLKEENPGLIICVCGCMMQQEGAAEKLMKRFPFVDIAFGTHNSHLFPGMLYRLLLKGERVCDMAAPAQDIIENAPARRAGPPCAWVTIMYGCDNFCSYCVVPYVRGRERSRQPEDIIAEINRLVGEGYKEVTLLGQNVNSYGKDITGADFPALLRRINDETGICRIRFMTSHPKDLSDGLISAMRDCKRVCRQIHLPVQSGSSAVLARMNRHYTREDYLALVEKLRSAMPDIGLSTDIIVGFPGETEKDFEDTMDMVQKIRFDSAYTFIYSKRSGTAAENMEGQVPAGVKKERIRRLIEAQAAITYEKNLGCAGKAYEVLAEAVSRRGVSMLCGRNGAGMITNFAAPPELIGEFIEVKIIGANRYTLLGEII